jgi:hypothetical protein
MRSRARTAKVPAVATAVIASAIAPAPAPAAFERPPLSPESEAMGGVLAVSPDGVWGNPAGAVGDSEWSASRRGELRAATARPFGLVELSESQVSLSLPWGDAAFGAGARRFGSQLYVEKEVRLVVAGPVVPALMLGTAARGLSAGGAFAPVRSFALDVAFLARPDSATAIGAVAEAVLGEVPGDARGERRRTAFGVARRLGRGAVLRVELQRHGEGPLAAALGFSWVPWSPLTLRAGAREDPRALAWGFTVRRAGVSLSGSASHASLGRTLRVGLRFSR